jgi:hypothetical protein
MVNSGARGKKDRSLGLRTEVGFASIIFKHLVPVIYINSTGTSGGVVASGSSLVLPLPRAAAGTRGQYNIPVVHCTII